MHQVYGKNYWLLFLVCDTTRDANSAVFLRNTSTYFSYLALAEFHLSDSYLSQKAEGSASSRDLSVFFVAVLVLRSGVVAVGVGISTL